MGYNTTVLILNDGLGEIERHPEQFVERLASQIHRMESGDVPVGNHANPVHVMSTAHADVPRLYYTHGNMILELSKWNKDTMAMATDERNPFRRKLLEVCIKDAQGFLTDLRRELKNG